MFRIILSVVAINWSVAAYAYGQPTQTDPCYVETTITCEESAGMISCFIGLCRQNEFQLNYCALFDGIEVDNYAPIPFRNLAALNIHGYSVWIDQSQGEPCGIKKLCTCNEQLDGCEPWEEQAGIPHHAIMWTPVGPKDCFGDFSE